MNMDFEELKRLMNFTSLEKDLVLIEDISTIPRREELEVQNVSAFMILVSGSVDIGINLNKYVIHAPALIIVLPGQITQFYGKSEDFKGLTISTSKQFNDFLEINTERGLPIFFRVKESPFVPLGEKELEFLSENFYMIKKIINHEDSLYRYEIAKHLSHVSFYMMLDILEKAVPKEAKKKTTQESLFESFIKYVQLFYKQERGLQFYADKLCITPKYLSLVIKNVSGKSASNWIDDYVVLESKALLRTSKKTIQQISDEFNFPSQSFFGKYFKRITGLSPKEYRAQ